MRGESNPQPDLSGYISLEERVPRDHVRSKMRLLVDTVLASMDADFAVAHSPRGVPRSRRSTRRGEARQLPNYCEADNCIKGTGSHKPDRISRLISPSRHNIGLRWVATAGIVPLDK
jgi:hypothetical protein